jgi:hypothetical protein
MRDSELRRTLLSALQPAPDLSCLRALHFSSAKQLSKLLRWLDHSGLALYLLAQLQDCEALCHCPTQFRDALELRLSANRRRTIAMIGEFGRLVQSFEHNDVLFCALKGLTLTPDFCRSAYLRHQTDFDFMIAQDSLANAKRVLRSCGYEQQEVRDTGEVTFATPLRHTPSPDDDIYATPSHREVDLLATLRHNSHGVSIDATIGCLEDVQNKELDGLFFPVLPLQQRFCLQVMHAFKHLLGSWVRVSWLYEIGYFLGQHFSDTELWRGVIQQMGSHIKAREAFGLVVSLTKKLFCRPIPKQLDDWCIRSLPPRIEAWVAHFGLKTAISDLDGAKWTLFVHREFIDHRKSWNSYLRDRILPVKRVLSIHSVITDDVRTRMNIKVSHCCHTIRRSVFHARALFTLPVEAIRWKYAVRSVERRRVLVWPTVSSDL